jgi:hypothetical protein
MAKVTAPLFSAEARGRVGGIVYNTWRGLATVKIKKAPAQPRTARQLIVRAYAKQLAQAWAVVSDVNRALWNAYAAAHPTTDGMGAPIRQTGLNWWLGLGSRLLDMAKSLVQTPPVTGAPEAVIAFVPTGGSGTISCAFTAHGGTTTSIELYLWGPHSAGIIPSLIRAKFKSRGPAETTPLVISSLGAGLYTVWARNVSETDGQASGWVSSNATVT